MSTVAIITDEVGWHSKGIGEAFQKRGCKVYFTALSEQIFSTAHISGFKSPKREDKLPDMAFVRCIPAGSFEQVTFYLDVLHGYERKGVTVCNSARVIERSVDKVMTSFLLKEAGLPTPETWAAARQDFAETVICDLLSQGRTLVMKPMFGSQGKGLQLIDRDNPSPDFFDESVYYFQEFIDSRDENGVWHDWRLFVIGGKVAAAMKRVGDTWVNNIAQGSKAHRADADAEMMHYAEQASMALGAAYAGIDLIRDRQGQCWLTEVNSIPAWQGLQAVADFDIADALADALSASLSQSP